MTDELIAQVRARVSDPATVHDMAQGIFPTPGVSPPATPAQIAATEDALGFPLPDLLKRLYTAVGNGGFGPGYGLIGVQGGYEDFGHGTLARLYHAYLTAPPDAAPGARWPARLLPICTWGCGIYSCLDCTREGASVLVYDPEAHVIDGAGVSEVTLTDANGEVIWRETFDPDAHPPQTAGITLKPHCATFRAWIAAWVAGVNLWEEMMAL